MHLPPRKVLVQLFLSGLLLFALWHVGRVAAHIALTARADSNSIQPDPEGVANDASRLSATSVREVLALAAEPEAAIAQLQDLLRRAQREELPVSIAGSRHSMGGHTIAAGGIQIDMSGLCHIDVSEDGQWFTAGGGAIWDDVLDVLRERGRAVRVMQSNNGFTIGGTLSVNAHGWQPGWAPMASTVRNIRVMLADGSVVSCSRKENKDLFRCVLGGYGMYGIILDAEFETAPDVVYAEMSERVKAEDFVARFDEQIHEGLVEPGFAFGRMRIDRRALLEEALLVRYVPEAGAEELPHDPGAPGRLSRLVFRGSVGSEYGKRLRWRLENLDRIVRKGRLHWRSDVQDEPHQWFANRQDAYTEILHEYFLPPENWAAGLAAMREVLLRHEADLLNVTIREVLADSDTILAYAPERRFSLVILFHQDRTERGEAEMQALTRELIDMILEQGGSYYLPYRPHATVAQFRRAYPDWAQARAKKLQYDPHELFQNALSRKYVMAP